jgi:hemerythrin
MSFPTPLVQFAPLPRIDREHFVILELASRLRTSLDKGVSKSEVEENLEKLMTRVRDHFSAEEEIMAAWAYPEFAEHAEEHRKLLEQFEKVSADFGAGAIERSGALGVFVERWVAQHIIASDQPFEAFLREATRPPRSEPS